MGQSHGAFASLIYQYIDNPPFIYLYLDISGARQVGKELAMNRVHWRKGVALLVLVWWRKARSVV